ncbi:MAG: hypothetical protein KAW01_06110, partial [Deltaproteobacteria bacterium]|nr:hypothetical protein [Deltaproteobacteria bacterium]
NPAARSVDCRFESEEGTFTFTLTAFYSGGTETPHSSPYTFTLSSSTLAAAATNDILNTYSLSSSTIPVGDGNYGLNQSVFAADFSGLEEGGSTLSPVLIYPQVLADDLWETEICVVNGSQSTNLVGILRPYSNDGTPLAGDLAIDLAPHGRYEFRLSENFPDPQRIGFLVLAANHDQAVGYTKFFIEGQGGVAVPAVSEINTADFYLPLTVSAQDWYTCLCLVNTTNAEKLLTIRFDNGEIRQVLLASREHKVFTIASLFDDDLNLGIKSATVENGAGIIGLELFSGNNNTFLCGIPLRDDRATDLSYPLHTEEPGWVSGIFTYNPLNQPCNLTITSYDEQGTELSSREISLGGYGQYVVVAGDPDLPAGAAWIHINSTVALTGFEVLVASNRLGAFSGVNSSGQSGIFTKLDNANGWTGIALVNSTAEEANVTLSAYDDGGNLVVSHDLFIPAFGKVAGPVAFVLPGDLSTATYLKYDSSATLVACQYNNSADDQMLDVLPAL